MYFFCAFPHHVCLAFLPGSTLAFTRLKKGEKIMPIMEAKKYQISYTSYLCKLYNTSVKQRQSSVP